MSVRIAKFFSFIGFIAFSIQTNAQSAWVKDKGELYTQLSYNTISSYNRIFNKNGEDLFTGREISDNGLQLYLEYGLSNKITVVGSLPIKFQKAGDVVENRSLPLTIEEGSLSAIGNAQLAFRYQLLKKKYNLTSQFEVTFPTDNFDARTGLNPGFNAYTFTPSFAFGRGYNNMYFQTHFGLSLRTNNYSNGLEFYIEGGKRFFNQFWVIPFFEIIDSFEDGNIVQPSQNFETFLALNDSEYFSFGVKLIEELNDNFGITGAVGGAFSAHQEAHKASLNIGLYYKFKKKEKTTEN